jgi:hypothetical protein
VLSLAQKVHFCYYMSHKLLRPLQEAHTQLLELRLEAQKLSHLLVCQDQGLQLHLSKQLSWLEHPVSFINITCTRHHTPQGTCMVQWLKA